MAQHDTVLQPDGRRRSGWCNRTLPRTAAYDPHQRCGGCECTAPGCPCALQNTADEDKTLDQLRDELL